MKKLIALATAATIGVAGVAFAVEADQGLTVKVTGSKGKKKKPRNVGITVTTTTQGKGANPTGSFGTKKAVVFFDKHLKFNPSKFPTCSESVVADDPDKCPSGSEVGKGSSEATAGTGPQINVHPTVRAFNGANNTLFLRVVTKPGEIDSSGVLTGKLKTASGNYGKKLEVTIPPKLQNQLGLWVTITKFQTTVRKTSKKGVGYVQSTGCSGGKYKFKADFTYTDDSKLSATATTKC